LKLNRRASLKWIGVMATSAAFPFSTSAQLPDADTGSMAGVAAWPDLDLAAVTASGYGSDPNLILPAPAPWPLTLTPTQLDLVAVLSDIIVPAEGDVPSASAVGVPEVINEWISAPYPLQQRHREIIVPGLVWTDMESTRRFGKNFVKVSDEQQLEIVDDIAFESPETDDLKLPVLFFDGLRKLVAGAFFSSPEGIKDIGYLGGVPIDGDYPGPTTEAMDHLKELVKSLGLSL
jgi:hypothetical protein